MRSKLFFIFFVLLISLSAVSALTCDVKTSCAIGETTLLKISGTTNAHAALASSGANYPYNLCCTVGTGSKTFLRLSGITNAHVQTNESYTFIYAEDATIDSASCEYASSCDSSQGFECILSISNSTNAHVGNCSAYSTKVCCKFESESPVQVSAGHRNYSSSDVIPNGAPQLANGETAYLCGEWSTCQPNGVQTRVCTNNVNNAQRIEKQNCVYSTPTQPAPQVNEPSVGVTAPGFNVFRFLLEIILIPIKLFWKSLSALFA